MHEYMVEVGVKTFYALSLSADSLEQAHKKVEKLLARIEKGFVPNRSSRKGVYASYEKVVAIPTNKKEGKV